MKKGIWRFFGILVLAGAIGISFIQLSAPVCGADGCPSDPFPPCSCTYLYQIDIDPGDGGGIRRTCYYGCNCPDSGGGGGHFYIEREVTVD